VTEDRLRALGWDETFAEAFAPHAERSVPGRVTLEHQKIYRVTTADGDVLARVRGRLRHHAERRDAFPAVGDWVAVSLGSGPDVEGSIEALLPRRSRFSRKVAGETTEEQVVAANVDTVFLVTGLDHDYNLRRIERYLTTAWTGGARPVIILAVIGAIGALAVQRHVIIAATAFAGAQTAVVGAAEFMGGRNLEAASRQMVHVYPLDPLPNTRLDLIAFVVLGLAGLAIQLRTTSSKKTKS